MLARGVSRSRRRVRGYSALAEINITPFVDVMMVLLIIFMVAAPMMSVAIPVDLPKTTGASADERSDDPLIVSVDKKGKLFLNETEVSEADLAARLQSIAKSNPEARVYLRGEKALSYDEIIQVMGIINRAGFAKIGLVAELPES